MEEELKNISKRLERIEEKLGIMHKDCSKMSQHIDFVERVWTKVRAPLGYFIGRPNIKEIRG
jgi:tetrahydromethanopterin S-methyltransferase subunit G